MKFGVVVVYLIFVGIVDGTSFWRVLIVERQKGWLCVVHCGLLRGRVSSLVSSSAYRNLYNEVGGPGVKGDGPPVCCRDNVHLLLRDSPKTLRDSPIHWGDPKVSTLTVPTWTLGPERLSLESPVMTGINNSRKMHLPYCGSWKVRLE